MASSADDFQARFVHATGGTLVRLSGVIDEHVDLKSVLSRAARVLVVDLDGVTRITSYGVREWQDAFLAHPHEYLGFINCRPALVTHFNIVRNFGAGGELLSFYAPYVCPQCQKEVQVLVDVRKDENVVRNFEPPEVQCPDCKLPAEFDDLPEAYLAHVSSSAAPNPPALVDALIEGRIAAQPKGPALSVEKEVEGRVTTVSLRGTLDGAARLKRMADGLVGHVVVNLGGIRSMTEEGLQALSKLLDEIPGRAVLADVPPEVSAMVPVRRDRFKEAIVASASLPFCCRECSAPESLSMDQSQVFALVSGKIASSRACRRCGGRLEYSGTQEALAHARDLPFGQAHPEVLAALQHRLRGDLERRLAGRTPTGELLKRPDGTGEIFGRYELVQSLGVGGMAEVLLARQRGPAGFEKPLVIKRILPGLSLNPDFVEMFLHEARLAARLSHPNIVQVFDLGEVEGRLFIAMEYVQGRDLHGVVRLAQQTGRKLPFEVAAYITAQICSGLHAAHSARDADGTPTPIVHRDISPHNVLVSLDGHVKLGDFGIAKSADSALRTPTATLKGKLNYLAPELLTKGAAASEPRSDIFSLGQVFYQLVTLQLPFRRESEVQTIQAIVEAALPKMSTHRPDVPEELERIAALALARSLEDRYQTAQAMQRDLEAFLRTAPAVGPEDVARWMRETESMPRKTNEFLDALDAPATSDLSVKVSSGVEPTRAIRKTAEE